MFTVCIVVRRNRHRHPRFWSEKGRSNEDGNYEKETTEMPHEDLEAGPDDAVDWADETQPPLSPLDELDNAISAALYSQANEKPERSPSSRHRQVW